MKKFMVIWTSQAVSLFGSAVVEFALAWYLTIKTGSATILATSMLVAILPQVVLGPFIGPYIDRWGPQTDYDHRGYLHIHIDGGIGGVILAGRHSNLAYLCCDGGTRPGSGLPFSRQHRRGDHDCAGKRPSRGPPG